MIGKELVSKLKDFNLNTYESKIWLALLMKGLATAGKLSEITDVPRSRCYDVLESLEKKGFIVMKVGRPIKYLAISPLEAIERTKQKFMMDAEERIQLVENIKKTDLINELNGLHNSSMNTIKPEDMTGLVKSDRNIKNHFIYMLKNANKVLLSTSSEGLKQKITILKEIMKVNSNIKVKILTEKNPNNAKLLKDILSLIDIKEVDNANEFCVTDKQAALFLTQNTKSENSVLLVNSEYSVNMLDDLFEAKWVTA